MGTNRTAHRLTNIDAGGGGEGEYVEPYDPRAASEATKEKRGEMGMPEHFYFSGVQFNRHLGFRVGARV